MNKIILLIIVSLFLTFSGCRVVKLAASDNIAGNAGNIAAGNAKRIENAPPEKAENQSKNVTGVYQSKDANHFNEFKVEDTGGELKIEFMGQYEFKTDSGSAMANTDNTDVLTATIDGDTAVVKPPDYPKCRYTLVFTGDKLNVRRDGTVTDCGLGGQITPEGVYRKVSGETPVFGEWFDNKTETSTAVNTPEKSNDSPDSNVVRVRFPKGSSEAILSGKIGGGAPVIYLVNARKGQTLEFRVLEGGENSDVVGEVFAPGGKNLTGEDYGTFWRGKLAQTGDHKISVGTIETENTNFKIQIAVK